MKRIINFRPMLYVALGLTIGILFAYGLMQNNIWLVVFISLFSLSYIFLTIFKKITILKPLTLIVFLIVGIVVFNADFYNFKNDYNGGTYTFESKIEYISQKDMSVTLILTDNTDLSTRKKQSGNFYATIYNYGGAEFCYGDIIEYTCTTSDISLFDKKSLNEFFYKYKINIIVKIDTSSIRKTDNKLTFTDKIRQKIKDNLYNGMDDEFASLSYSCLFGDKSYIDDEVYEIFSLTSIAHILAVSGLHISIFILFISFLLDKLKAKNFVRFFVVFAVIFIYLALCSFCISAVRASVMALMLLLSKITYKRYDVLSSLSLSVIILLLLNPMNLFMKGFLLSVTSVLAIILIYPLLKKLWYRIFDFENAFSDTFILTLSIQILINPIIIGMYGKINILAVLLNPVILPIFTIFYISLLICSIICFILPFMPFLLLLPQFICKIIIIVAELFSYKFFLISINNLPAVCGVILLIMAFCMSKYLMVKTKSKFIVTVVLTSVLLLTVIINPLIISYGQKKEFSLTCVKGISNTFLINNHGGFALINSANQDESQKLINYLEDNYINKIDFVIYSKFTGNELNIIETLGKNFGLNKIFVPYEADEVSLYRLNMLNISVETYTETTLDSITYTYVYTNYGSGINISASGYNLFMFNTSNPNNSKFLNYLVENNYRPDLLKIHTCTSTYNGVECRIICEETQLYEKSNIICLKDYLGIKILLDDFSILTE